MTHPPRKGSLIVIFLTVFIDLLGFGIVLPLLPVYGRQFAADYGWSERSVGVIVGLLLSSFSAMQFLFLPVWGRASDRWGRRPILLIGLAGSTLFYGGFAVATMLRSLTGLFLTRIGAGIAGATIATAAAYIADTTPKEKRAKGMALIGAAFALGFTLGPSLGVVALLAGGEVALSPWPGYLASALSGVALVLAVFLLPESLHENAERGHRRLFDFEALGKALATPTIGLLLLTSFIAVFSFTSFESTLSLQIEKIVRQLGDHPPDSAVLGAVVRQSQAWGYTRPEEIKSVIIFAAFSYLGLTLTLAQGFLVRRFADRVPEGLLALVGGAAGTLGFILLARATALDSFSLLLVAMTIEVVGFAFVNPSLQSLLSRRSREDEQGGILGLGQSISSLARILGPACAVPLFTYQAAAPYYAASVSMVVAVLLIAWVGRHGHDAD